MSSVRPREMYPDNTQEEVREYLRTRGYKPIDFRFPQLGDQVLWRDGSELSISFVRSDWFDWMSLREGPKPQRFIVTPSRVETLPQRDPELPAPR